MAVQPQPVKTAMIVTDVYPPVPAVGTYRTVALCRCLIERGWHVTVITARPAAGVFLDHALLEQSPAAVRVLRTASPHLPTLAVRLLRKKPRAAAQDPAQGPATAAAPYTAQSRKSTFRKTLDWLSWWIHLPDGLTGWFAPAVWAGLREARRERPEVIYCTAPAWTSLLVGTALSRLLRLPLHADFQDPWCGSAWHKLPYRTHQRIDEALERWVVRRARQITCAWDGIRKHLAARYPHRQKEIRTILNGFPPGEIEGIAPRRLDETRCVFLHTGTFYGPRSPIPLLEGLRRFKDQHPADANGLLIAFVGQPEYDGRPIQDLVHEHGADGLVRVIPFVTRREALALLKGADIAMLFGQSGSDALASVPGKTYDYVSAVRRSWPSARATKRVRSCAGADAGSGLPAQTIPAPSSAPYVKSSRRTGRTACACRRGGGKGGVRLAAPGRRTGHDPGADGSRQGAAGKPRP